MKKLITIVFVTGCVFAQGVLINEYLAGNEACCTDEHGDYDDFIELYNGGSASVDVGGMYITDDLAEPTLHQIPTTSPDSTTIAPGEFLLLWADKESEQGILHIEIKLGKSGEQIGLYASDGETVVDTLTFGAQTDDISIGRSPDGSDTWVAFDTPTPGLTNGELGLEKNTLPSSFVLDQNYPNPFNPETKITFNLPEEANTSLVVYNLLGTEIKTLVNNFRQAGAHTIGWNGLDNQGNLVSGGVYLYRIKTEKYTLTKKMLFLK
ncbi:MAG: hypothetical protein CMG75_02470 [Candidatus Marinimicrobia bacterium]|nr:hypothetical protein [Candidatus Neomarinimicrobiota bacterium]|tara:strand:- start:3379 stop:4173 length:795 start_codon:yes stop_codon:yes gene_type:complete